MADYPDTDAGRQAARDAGNWVGRDDSGGLIIEPGHPGGDASNGPQGTGPSSPGNSGDPSLSGYVAAMAASSGFSIKQLEEQKREFDATLEWQKQQWREQGLPELAIKQRAQDLEDKKFGELQRSALVSEQLQTRAQDLDEKIKSGQLSLAQATQAFNEEMGRGQLAVSQGQLGLDTLKTAASLSGPENWIQASNFARGVQGNQNLSGFVGQLMGGQSTAVMGGPQPGAQMSNPLSMGGMAAGLTGEPQPGQPGQVQPMMATGAQAGQPMTPEQMQQAQMQRMQQAQQQYQQQMGGQPGAPGAAPGPPMTPEQMQAMQQQQQAALQGAQQQFNAARGTGVTPMPTTTPDGQPMTMEQMQAAQQAQQQRLQQAQQQFQAGVPGQAGPPAGFWTTIANGQQVYTPTAPGATGGQAAGGQMGIEPWNGGGAAAKAGGYAGATQDDVARMFGRPAGAQQPAGFGADTNAAQEQMKKLFAQGGQALGPQQLEGLTDTERKMMEGGGAALGADVAGFKEQYTRSRIGQSASKPGSFSGM